MTVEQLQAGKKLFEKKQALENSVHAVEAYRAKLRLPESTEIISENLLRLTVKGMGELELASGVVDITAILDDYEATLANELKKVTEEFEKL